MTPAEAAAALNGNEYGKEGTKELFGRMKAAGLVAVFGYSDDNMEFRGAIDDEIGCYDGGTAYLNDNGLLKSECDEGDDCPYYEKLQKKARSITALWCPTDADPQPSWAYATDIPHVTFEIMETDELFCRGIVFRLADAKEAAHG